MHIKPSRRQCIMVYVCVFVLGSSLTSSVIVFKWVGLIDYKYAHQIAIAYAVCGQRIVQLNNLFIEKGKRDAPKNENVRQEFNCMFHYHITLKTHSAHTFCGIINNYCLIIMLGVNGWFWEFYLLSFLKILFAIISF